MTNEIPEHKSANARQDICRQHLDSAEEWLRKFVHFKLMVHGGENYITSGTWKKTLVDAVARKIAGDPGKFKREVDATTLEQLIDLVCHPNSWSVLSCGLASAYPHGREEARTFLERLKEIRNDFSHGRQCSARQLERAICYGNDIADSIKEYFRVENLSKEFNVPTFVAYTDNIGNTERLNAGDYYRVANLSMLHHKRLYPGNLLVAEVEVDPSFDADSYEVEWRLKTSPGGNGTGNLARIEMTMAHVGQRMELQFKLKTTAEWHRDSGGCDDVLDIYYVVAPPPT